MAVKFQDYYQVLGVSRSASADEIRHAYRKIARENHPDVNKVPAAEAKFKQATEAYEVLKDADKRRKYDELGEHWKHGQEFRPPPGSGMGGGPYEFRTGGPGGASFHFEGGDFSDFFEQFFGARMGGGGGAGAGGTGGARGRNPFQDHMGRGGPFGGGGGAGGQMPGQDATAELTVTLQEAYHGTSRQVGLQLPDGSTRTLDVKIPAGITHGATMRLKGQGNPSPTGDAKAGDLLLKISLAHDPRFTAEGHDLTTTLTLSPWEAVLGAKVPVTTLDGEVTLTVPAGAQSGQRMRLRAKGLPRKDGERGDLYAELRIATPKTLTDEEREQWEKIREISKFDPRGSE